VEALWGFALLVGGLLEDYLLVHFEWEVALFVCKFGWLLAWCVLFIFQIDHLLDFELGLQIIQLKHFLNLFLGIAVSILRGLFAEHDHVVFLELLIIQGFQLMLKLLDVSLVGSLFVGASWVWFWFSLWGLGVLFALGFGLVVGSELW
jgi:hypothetical protein